MSQTERANRTLTELHEEVSGFDTKIKKQKGIVGDHGRSIVKEFTPAKDAQPEDIINGIYAVGQRRILLTTRLEDNSLPYLKEKKAYAQEVQEGAVLQAREAYEGIQALARLGVYSPAEQALLEEGISRLPEEIVQQIRTSSLNFPEQQTQQSDGPEQRKGFFGRLFRRGNKPEKPEEPIIDNVPPLRPNVLANTTTNAERIIPEKVERVDKNASSLDKDSIKPFQGEIPDVEKIVGKKAIVQQKILTAIFEATLANEDFTKTDFAKKLFKKELEEGSMTEEKAVKMFVDSLQWVKKKAKNHGYEIYNPGGHKNTFYKVGIKEGLENIQESPKEELLEVNASPTLLAETNEEDTQVERKFPDGKFLGNEKLLPRRIYEAIIDFSLHGKLPASEDLENIIFAEEIKTGQLTQKEAHVRMRDGLSLLRKKLKGTGLNLTNKGTGKFPFYKIDVTGQTERILNPITAAKSADSLSINNVPETVLNSDSESISFPPSDVIAQEETIRRKYYEYLVAQHNKGHISTMEEEAIYVYGENNRTTQTRIYMMRAEINLRLKPYGIHVGAEKRGVKTNEKPLAAQAVQTEIPAPEETPVLNPPDGEVKQNQGPEESDVATKITLRAGERKTLQMLDGTSSENSLTTDEIAAKFSPGKKIRKEDITTINTFIAGLKSFSLTGTGIEILHPLTEDGNPILNRHYLKLPEGKLLEDLVDFESGVPSHIQTTRPEAVERIAVSVASIDLDEGKAVEILASATPEQEIPLPHFVLDEAGMEVEFSGRKSSFRFADQWEIFKRIAGRANEELTPHELAGLDPQTRDTKALEQAENHFRNFITRFEENPNQPQIFIISGGNRYPKFTFRATAEFISNPNKAPSENPSQ